jgi:hypothetical protein
VVDAFIMPVAPTAAVIPGKYMYYGMSPFTGLAWNSVWLG